MTWIGCRFVGLMLSAGLAVGENASSERVFSLRPKKDEARTLGHIGPTGIQAHIQIGVKVTVEGMRKGSPADGKFQKSDVIVAVNGTSLEGANPYVVLGNAITATEAGNGTMVFDLVSDKGPRKVTIKIPAFGAYSKTWPVNCPKSDKIKKNAAAFYHKQLTEGMSLEA